jgi:GNAT superfamily N-acetyltransferase
MTNTLKYMAYQEGFPALGLAPYHPNFNLAAKNLLKRSFDLSDTAPATDLFISNFLRAAEKIDGINTQIILGIIELPEPNSPLTWDTRITPDAAQLVAAVRINKDHDPTSDVWHLNDLCVHPEQQGKGFGTRVLWGALKEIEGIQKYNNARVELTSAIGANFYKPYKFEISKVQTKDPGYLTPMQRMIGQAAYPVEVPNSIKLIANPSRRSAAPQGAGYG